MIKINKYETSLSSFPIGTKIQLISIVNDRHHSAQVKDFANDRIASEIVIDKEILAAELWVRHLLDECETVDGWRLETFLLNRIVNEKDFELPDALTIVGYNSIAARVIVETQFSNHVASS